MQSTEPKGLLVPPLVSWPAWRYQQWQQTRQGQHVLFCGPTQSGKTLLCREVTRFHRYVVVFGTKPVDRSLDAYVHEGYVRIDHWPASRSEIRRSMDTNDGAVRLILWPKMKKREDLRRFRDIYRRAMEEMFVEGKWCFVLDEGLWMASRKGLDLGQVMADMAYGSASNGVSMHLLVQRPANLPPDCWTNCMQALIFHGGNTRDVRELASLSTYPPRDTDYAIRRLTGHQFLDLPCRGGASWSVSEVDVTQIAVR